MFEALPSTIKMTMVSVDGREDSWSIDVAIDLSNIVSPRVEYRR